MQIIQSIQNNIYNIRGERVVLDYDLAILYEVETRVMNQAIKRNIEKFPEDFMFRLTAKEWEFIQLQNKNSVSSQIVMMDLPKNNIYANNTKYSKPYLRN
jgi:phosphopantetheine adenylyltransferase